MKNYNKTNWNERFPVKQEKVKLVEILGIIIFILAVSFNP